MSSYGYITVWLFIYLLMDFELSLSTIIQIKVVWTFMLKSVCVHILSFLLGKYLGMDSLGHMIDVGLTLFLVFIYLAAPGLSCSMQDFQLMHVGSSSLNKDQARALCIETSKSQPPDYQGRPLTFFTVSKFFQKAGIISHPHQERMRILVPSYLHQHLFDQSV